ncbi:MAG: hypothetical protein DRQ78_09850, partial [Epsilonproteobacteria bacterium]
MGAKQKTADSKIKNIITCNPYTDKQYIFGGNKPYRPEEILTFNQANYITSYVDNKDLISTIVSISRSIPEEEVTNVIEIKAYEELGLDPAIAYNITYSQGKDSGSETEYYVFVAEPERLDELFVPLKKQTKYIDLIIPAPLLMQGLYKKEILQDSSVHCFVYFGRQDALVTFYSSGKYVYSKSIDYSLDRMYERYCEIVGEKVDEKEFFHTLETEGLKTVNVDYQQNFMKLFGDIFLTINDIVIYAKRAFELTAIDQIFIGSTVGSIIGLDDYSQNYLGLNSSEFNFNYNIPSDEWYIDQFQYLALIASIEYIENLEEVANLTQYFRPPSFANRASGQFVMVVISAISLALAWPLGYLVGAYLNDAKIYALTSENKDVEKQVEFYKSKIATKQIRSKQLDRSIKADTIRYSAKTKTLKAIYDKKVNYTLKSEVFYTFSQELRAFDLHIDHMQSTDDTFIFSVVGSDDKRITEFIKHISAKFYDKIAKINIDIIEKESESDFYKAIVEV